MVKRVHVIPRWPGVGSAGAAERSSTKDTVIGALILILGAAALIALAIFA